MSEDHMASRDHARSDGGVREPANAGRVAGAFGDVAYVDIGDGAQVTVPLPDYGDGNLGWRLRYSRPGRESDLYSAASVIESFDYLIRFCNREEAWRRLRIMRAAIAEIGDSGHRPGRGDAALNAATASPAERPETGPGMSSAKDSTNV